MFKVYTIRRYIIQVLYKDHWYSYSIFKVTYKLEDLIRITEQLYFYNKRVRFRIFDYELGKVVYE